MRRLITALLFCGLVMSFWVNRAQSAQPSPKAAQKLTKQAIVGAWRLVSIQYSGPNGALADPVFGPNPQGIIIYEQSGWMSVQIVTANRPVMIRPATRTSGVVTAETPSSRRELSTRITHISEPGITTLIRQSLLTT